MFTIQDGIKYVGFAAILYFLLKAFLNNKLDNSHIAVIVLIIMILVIFIGCQNVNCPLDHIEKARIEKARIEKFQNINEVANQSATDQLIAQQLHSIGTDSNPSPSTNMNSLALNSDNYQKIIDREKEAMKKIKDNYCNDMVYTSSHPLNTIPLGASIYGYNYLPPENWFRPYDQAEICIMDAIGGSRIASCSDKSIDGLMEFETNDNQHTANIHLEDQYKTSPIGINLEYVNDVLNKNK